MLRNIATIFVTIVVILFAVYYNWLYELYIVFGFTRPLIEPYNGGKCKRIEGGYWFTIGNHPCKCNVVKFIYYSIYFFIIKTLKLAKIFTFIIVLDTPS